MDSWDHDEDSASPEVKYEPSPAESLLSLPGEMYPSLFQGSNTPGTMSHLDLMSLQNATDDTAQTPSSTAPPTPTTDKKPTKKRKSWGQVLPEPKTNLPPRKRAKTEDEKEQRRVERVLRNRRAAQSSRERKRQEVEALETRNQQLEEQLNQFKKENLALMSRLAEIEGGSPSGVVTRNPITLSSQLFSSHDSHSFASQSQSTINPASLSPALTPVPEADDEQEGEAQQHKTLDAPAVDATPAPETFADMTQHPAEMLWPQDLQCQSAMVSPTWMAPQQSTTALFCLLSFLATALPWITRPRSQIRMALRAQTSIPPAQSILNSIIWWVTKTSSTPSCHPTSTLTTTSTNRRPSTATAVTATSSLRLGLLRKILTCSPMLARPLLDATMGILRLVRSEEAAGVDGVGLRHHLSRDGAVGTSSASAGPRKRSRPSQEALLALMWAIKVEERRMRACGTMSSMPELETSCHQKFALSVRGLGHRRRAGRHDNQESTSRPLWRM